LPALPQSSGAKVAAENLDEMGAGLQILSLRHLSIAIPFIRRLVGLADELGSKTVLIPEGRGML